MVRMKLAFIFSPLIPVIYMLLLPWISGNGYSGRYYAAFVFIFSLPVSYLATYAIGLPIIRILKKWDLLSVLNVTISAAIVGATVFTIFSYGFSRFLGSSVSSDDYIHLLISGGLLGAFVGLTFGVIAGLPLMSQKSV